MRKPEKWQEYAAKITATIQEMFDEENEYHINLAEFQNDDNATQFFHALGGKKQKKDYESTLYFI